MFTILLSLTRVKNYLFRVRYHSSQFQLKTERLFPIEKRTGSDILDAHPLITQMAYLVVYLTNPCPNKLLFRKIKYHGLHRNVWFESFD